MSLLAGGDEGDQRDSGHAWSSFTAHVYTTVLPEVAQAAAEAVASVHATRMALTPKPVPPSVGQVTGWLTRRPDSLTGDETLQLKKILDRSPALSMTYQHVRDFADIMTTRDGHRLPGWMAQIDTDGTPDLRSLVAGFRTDLAAVTAGLTLPYSSGPVEGQVNRIKMIKRQMYGRVGFDLLRKRVLHARDHRASPD